MILDGNDWIKWKTNEETLMLIHIIRALIVHNL